MNPDDKLKLSNETQTICDGLVKPAFMRLREHLDYYFIPATQLWMPFDNFVTGQNSYFSSSVKNVNDGDVPVTVPTFTLNYLNTVLPGWTNYELFDDADIILVLVLSACLTCLVIVTLLVWL